MGDDWDEEVAEATAPSVGVEVLSSDLPEIKLFGKWSCDEVNVSDMSLQVIFGLKDLSFSNCCRLMVNLTITNNIC